MNVGLPLRNTNGACGNGSRTALMWAPSEEHLFVYFHPSKINRAGPNLVSILSQKCSKIFAKGILCKGISRSGMLCSPQLK